MATQFDRTALVIGDEGVALLKSKKVILFGVGGVGSYVAEALVRSGVGSLTIVDKDVLDLTNLNRQLPALHSTLGQPKVEVMAERLRDINPAAQIIPRQEVFLPENAADFQLESYDYIVDAVDMVTAKLTLAEMAAELGVPLIASMGTGNKLDPSRLVVTDIYKTEVDPLAKVMRRELKARGIKKLKVVYSPEVPVIKRTPPGSTAFVPGAAGLLIASEVVRDFLKR